MSDMVHRIKAVDNAERRDYNADEVALINSGRYEQAKVAWHQRTGR